MATRRIDRAAFRGSGSVVWCRLGDAGEALASAVEFGYGAAGRTVGAVVAVRPTESGAEVDIHVTGDTAWQRLAARGARVDVGCAFTGMVGMTLVVAG